jgi:hypothetical protein
LAKYFLSDSVTSISFKKMGITYLTTQTT